VLYPAELRALAVSAGEIRVKRRGTGHSYRA
jgi:hypothetical protein